VTASTRVDDVLGEHERVRGRRVGPVGHRDHGHPGRVGRAQAVGGVLDGGAAFGPRADPAGRLEVDVGGGLAAGDLFGGDVSAELVMQPRERQHQLDQLAVGRRRDGQRVGGGQLLHRRGRAGQQRQVVAVALGHGGDDGAADLVGGLLDAQLVVQVGLPLGRAHALHRGRGRVGIRPPGGHHDGPSGRVPALLGVDQHPVHVEDDGIDHPFAG
jgi:hypothetical protein